MVVTLITCSILLNLREKDAEEEEMIMVYF